MTYQHLKGQFGSSEEGLCDALTHSQWLTHSTRQSAHVQFGETGKRIHMEAKQCPAVVRGNSKTYFSHLKKINISLLCAVFRIFTLLYLAVRRPTESELLYALFKARLHPDKQWTNISELRSRRSTAASISPRVRITVRLRCLKG